MNRIRLSRSLRRALRSVLALAFVLLLAVPQCAPAAHAVTQADIDALKGDAADLTSQKKELKKKLESLSDDKAQVLKKKDLLDQQINTLLSQISNAEKQISDYAALIAQAEARLADAQQKEQAQYELFCQRVRAMEEAGTVSYWSVIFKATSFSDMLSRLDAVNEVMDADQRVIDELQALQKEISDQQAVLEESKAGAEAVKAELVSQKQELNTQRTAANKLIAQINDNADEYQDTLDAIAREEEEIQDQIVKKSRELAAQQAAAGHASNAALGGYIWPVDSHKITSKFGYRPASATNGIGSTGHKGVDIGGVGYTSTIRAAKAGTVIVSQYSSSYGNYVVISHGSGNTTLYGHMSSRSVSVGAYVNQGDAIGVTGSTGHSTGPHLHFEISENGVRIDPLKYLTGYYF